MTIIAKESDNITAATTTIITKLLDLSAVFEVKSYKTIPVAFNKAS